MAPPVTDLEIEDMEAPELVEMLLALEPVPPDPAVRARLLRSVAATPRFDTFVDRVAGLLDVVAAKARELLARVDDAASWVAGPGPDVSLYHLEGGANLAGAIAGFVRVVPGGEFPHHEHLGEETVLVIQGGFHDGAREVRRGEVATMPADTAHGLRALPDVPLIYLAIVQRGVRIGDVDLLAGDPRI